MIGFIFIELKNKLSYFGSFFLITAISVPALYFIPTNSDDLYRYFLEMDIVRPFSKWSSLFKAYYTDPYLLIHGSNQQMNYLYNIFQWLISRNGNYALLPFLSVLIIYLCITIPFVHQDVIKNHDIPMFILGSLMVIAVFQYTASISTIRWNMASAIFFLIVYISFNCKFNKLYTLPLYIIPLLIHEGMILPMVIAIICIMLDKIHIRWYMYVAFVFVLFIIFHLMSNGTNNASQNFQFYNSSNITDFFGGSRFMVIFALLSSLVPYVYLFMSTILLKDNKQINYNLEFKMTIFFVITDLSLLFDLTLANRYALNVGLCGVLIYLRTEKDNGTIRPSVRRVLLIAAIIYILITIAFIIIKEHYNFTQINFNGLYDVTKTNLP